MPNKGVARLTIGIDTKAAMKSPDMKINVECCFAQRLRFRRRTKARIAASSKYSRLSRKAVAMKNTMRPTPERREALLEQILRLSPSKAKQIQDHVNDAIAQYAKRGFVASFGVRQQPHNALASPLRPDGRIAAGRPDLWRHRRHPAARQMREGGGA